MIKSDYPALAILRDRLINWVATMQNVSMLAPLQVEETTKNSLKITIVIETDSQPVTLSLNARKDDLICAGNEITAMDRMFEACTQKLRLGIVRAFYKNYDVLFEHNFKHSGQVCLKSEYSAKCRFCGGTEPSAEFKKRAHAIPECTGNKSLFTSYECDDCNQQFGSDIEDHFGRWSNGHRSLLSVKGKKGIPNLYMKGGHVKVLDDVTEIKLPDDTMFQFNDDQTEATLSLPMPQYNSIAVMKALNKMAISVMPDSEIPDFQPVINWIRSRDHSVRPPQFYSSLLFAYSPALKFKEGFCALLRRTTGDLNKPYMTFVLSFGGVLWCASDATRGSRLETRMVR